MDNAAADAVVADAAADGRTMIVAVLSTLCYQCLHDANVVKHRSTHLDVAEKDWLFVDRWVRTMTKTMTMLLPPLRQRPPAMHSAGDGGDGDDEDCDIASSNAYANDADACDDSGRFAGHIQKYRA